MYIGVRYLYCAPAFNISPIPTYRFFLFCKIMENLIKKIKAHAKKNYSSSPHEFSDEDINVIIGSDCECDHCGKSIFELDDFPTVIDGSVYCEECEDEEFNTICTICENSFTAPTTPEDTQIVVTKELAKMQDMKAGIYQVVSYPYTRNCLLFGFESFVGGSLKLIKEIDIEDVKSKITQAQGHPRKIEITSGQICYNCVAKYAEGKAETGQYYQRTKEESDRINAEIWSIINPELIKQ